MMIPILVTGKSYVRGCGVNHVSTIRASRCSGLDPGAGRSTSSRWADNGLSSTEHSSSIRPTCSS
jgi:hypothetical protein